MPQGTEEKNAKARCRKALQRAKVCLHALWGRTCAAWGGVTRRILPAEGLGKADMALLRWVSLCAAVLLPVGLLQVTGAFAVADEWQVKLLLGHPFYMDAQDSGTLLLGRGGVFALCLPVTLYLAAVLLQEKRWGHRTQVAALAMGALALPGMLCIFWSGVLHMAAPVLCVALLWGLCFLPFFNPARHA